MRIYLPPAVIPLKIKFYRGKHFIAFQRHGPLTAVRIDLEPQ